MNVPKLRFPGFNDQWDRKSIQLLVDELVIDKPMDGNHGEIHPTSEDYVEDGIPFVMASDINDGVVDLSKAKKIAKAQADTLRKGFSIEGDILLTHKATIGNVAIVPELQIPYIMLTPQVTYYRILNKAKLDQYFLKCLFEAPQFQNELKALCTGATRLYIGISEQRKLYINFCNSVEQTKIATFLSAVDEKIAQLSRKHELLQQYKHGMMQQLFSQKLRFKDDKGEDFPEWKEKIFGDIADIKRGASPRPISDPKWFDKNSNIGWVRISDVSKSSQILNKTEQFLSKEGISKSRLVPAGNIIMSICATIGKPIYTGFDVCIHDGFVVFENLKISSQYLYYFLIFIEKKWHQYGQPGTQVNLNSDIVNQEIIFVPCSIEQIKISNLLASIDNKINVVANQLQQAREWKQGLLQQMFV